MNASNLISRTQMVFEATLDHLSGELARMRTGRAHPSMFEEVIVEAYGTKMPLNQVANITVPEAQLLQITPFDPNNLQAISNAIRNNQSLGLNPSDDGRVVRVQIPPLTEERRKELAKQIGEKLEEAQIRMRNARHEAFKELDAAKKDKQISEDDVKRTEKAIEDNMTLFRNRMEQAAKAKEKEILTL